MVSVLALDPGELGSYPGWFAVTNSNQKLSFTNSISVWYSSKYCKPGMGDVGGGKKSNKDALANLETIYRHS